MRAKRVVCFGFLLFLRASFMACAQAPPSADTVDTFFNAITENDTNAVFKMLDADTNLTRALWSGRLPLHVAASKGFLEITKELLRHGADINAQNDTLDTFNVRLTALEAAIWYNRPEVCKYLLEAGADPNIQSSFEGGALHYAFTYQRTNMATWLLDFGANPFLEKSNPYNKATPFELAITRGDDSLVSRMLEIGRTNFSTATSRPRRNETKQTLSGFLAVRGTVLLSTAAQRGELKAVQSLLKAGASAKGTNEDGSPLLQSFAVAEAAATKGNGFDTNRWLKIRDLLIGNGADYDAFAATAIGDISHARDLLVEDKNVIRARDHEGQTPLHWAVLNDRLPLTSFWLQAGVPPGATNSGGRTALHLAAEKGLTGQVKVLLAARAPIDVRDTNGQTALDLAEHAKQSDTIRLLLPNNAGTSHPDRAAALPIHQAAASGNIALLTALTESTNNLEARDELGLTPLEIAVQHGHLAAAALLVDKGADVNARDPEGNTMLHQIILRGFQFTVQDRPPTNWVVGVTKNARNEIYKKYLLGEEGRSPVLQGASFLLACGMDVKATNGAGRTVMQLATDKEISERLAFFDDDQATFLKLLGSSGSDVNQRDADGNTALHHSVEKYKDLSGDETAVLIAAGSDVNATNYQGRTPLHTAVVGVTSWPYNDGPKNGLQKLLEAKADVNVRDNEGLTPLHLVALVDNGFREETVRALLDAGADPKAKDKQGRTPVHLFLSGEWPWSHSAEDINLLLKAGADLSEKDKRGRTPLHYLAALGDKSVMFFMHNIGTTFENATNVDFQARDNDGNTPLHIAAKTGTGDVMSWLIKHGGDLDATNNAGETARSLGARRSPGRFGPSSADTDIFQAAREGKMEALTALVKTDANLVNQTNQFGQTPLRVAVMSRQTNAMEFLERNGAKWDAVSALLVGRADVLRGMLAKERYVVTNAFVGRDLLHIAVIKGDVELVNMILDAGADLRATDPSGLSALGVALQKKRPEVVEVLRHRGATQNVFDAVQGGDVSRLSVLLDRTKSEVNATNAMGSFLLEAAARVGNTNIIGLLLDRGAKVNSTNQNDGRTPLHVAALYNQNGAAKLLLARRASASVCDYFGFTPLHVASIAGARETAAVLLEHKVNPDERAIEPNGKMTYSMMPPHGPMLIGSSALHLAALNGKTNVVELLLKSGASVNLANGFGQTPLDLASQPGYVRLRLPPFFESFRTNDPTDFAGPGQRPDPRLLMEQQKTAAEMLEKAGGKRSESRVPSGPGMMY